MAWLQSASLADACLQSYKESTQVVLVVGQNFGSKRTYKTVDETYSVAGITEAAAKALCANVSAQNGWFAEARKVYASDGWEVTATHHETTVTSESVQV